MEEQQFPIDILASALDKIGISYVIKTSEEGYKYLYFVSEDEKELFHSYSIDEMNWYYDFIEFCPEDEGGVLGSYSCSWHNNILLKIKL